jgi:predicted GNAT family N-acyltransferase
MEVQVIPVAWDSHREILQKLRGIVFIEEQGVPQEVEWDGQDEDAQHFLAINEAGQSIGCARLLPSGQIGRMAVLQIHRGIGIGLRLLEAAVASAKELGLRKVFLHAQTQAIGFYHKGGFLNAGGEFMEAGIPHQPMELELAIPFESVEGVEPPHIVVQEAEADSNFSELLQYYGEGECREGIAASVQWAKRKVRIYSQGLDHTLFDDRAVIAALSTFIRRGPPTKLQILVHSTHLIVGRGHRLLELARHLDSKIDIRRVPSDISQDPHSCVTCDQHGFFLLPDYREYQGFANRYDPVQTTRLADRFDYLWRRSQSDPELRTLRL